jgi:hypothetical protein
MFLIHRTVFMSTICCICLTETNCLSAFSFFLPKFHTHLSISEMMQWVSLWWQYQETLSQPTYVTSIETNVVGRNWSAHYLSDVSPCVLLALLYISSQWRCHGPPAHLKLLTYKVETLSQKLWEKLREFRNIFP